MNRLIPAAMRDADAWLRLNGADDADQRAAQWSRAFHVAMDRRAYQAGIRQKGPR